MITHQINVKVKEVVKTIQQDLNISQLSDEREQEFSCLQKTEE